MHIRGHSIVIFRVIISFTCDIRLTRKMHNDFSLDSRLKSLSIFLKRRMSYVNETFTHRIPN